MQPYEIEACMTCYNRIGASILDGIMSRALHKMTSLDADKFIDGLKLAIDKERREKMK